MSIISVSLRSSDSLSISVRFRTNSSFTRMITRLWMRNDRVGHLKVAHRHKEKVIPMINSIIIWETLEKTR